MAPVYHTTPVSAMALERQALRDAWIALLGRWQWEWFCTFTFRDMVHPEAADKRFRVLISQANRRWVRALEYQKSDVIHWVFRTMTSTCIHTAFPLLPYESACNSSA